MIFLASARIKMVNAALYMRSCGVLARCVWFAVCFLFLFLSYILQG